MKTWTENLSGLLKIKSGCMWPTVYNEFDTPVLEEKIPSRERSNRGSNIHYAS